MDAEKEMLKQGFYLVKDGRRSEVIKKHTWGWGCIWISKNHKHPAALGCNIDHITLKAMRKICKVKYLGTALPKRYLKTAIVDKNGMPV
ncbi:MAG: hypothetical protein WC196_02755 [Bacilli bacterium]